MSYIPSYKRFFAELKRRRVFRVMAVYGAVAFVVVQVADLAFPRLGMPDWTITLVLLLSLLGFPIAIVLTWAFEQTPQGLKRTERAAPELIDRIASAPPAQRWPMGLAAAAGTALLLVGVWWVLDGPGADSAVAALDSDDPVESIAVLPFADLSPEGDQAYFGDGLAEELLDALARVNGLRVAARTSSFRFRGEDVDIPDVATRLNVQTVLEGSVRSGGDRVRITAQLVNAEGFHLWSQSYDRTVVEMEDLIGVQEEIAQSIVAALSLAPDTAAGEILETLVAQGTDDLEAYNAVLRGRHLMARRTSAGLAGAIEQFERAISLDSDYARAWADLSMASSLSIGWYYAPRDGPTEQRGKEAAERALQLDPRMAEAYAARGYIHSWVDYDSAAAQQDFARAIELNPRFPTSYHWRGEILSDRGHPESGIPYLETAHELDPLSPIIMVDLADAYDRAGRWQRADTLLASALELEPEYGPALQGLTFHAMSNGDARAALDYQTRFVAAITDSVTSTLPSHRLLLVLAHMAGEHQLVVDAFRELVPADGSPIPQALIPALDEVAWSLNEVEGGAAVRSFAEAQVPRILPTDSIQALELEGFAAAVSGDTASALSIETRLAAAADRGVGAARAARRFVAIARGDVEAASAGFQVPEDPGPISRFYWEHSPVLQQIVRGKPAYQAMLDAMPPYTGPAGQGSRDD